MKSWLRSSRPRLLGISVVLLMDALIWPTQWLLGKTEEDDGAGIANVLALPVSALSLLAGVGALLVALWPRPRVDDPAVLAAQARLVLGLVAAEEARVLAQLLGDTGNPRPADVGFAQPEAATLRWRTDGGAQDGSLTTIADYYDTLDLGRLVVLGEAGAGKTVLVLRLLLDLAARARRALDADPQARVQVPVRLSLPSFATPDGPVAASSLRGRLEEWVADHLTDVHRIQKPLAVALVRDGWILPVLDGLDEMDPDQGVPSRAQQVITALNQPAGVVPGPVVLASRTQHYQYLNEPLQDATAVLVQPLGSEQVIAWLAHRFPDPTQPDRLQRRWQRVASVVRRHPSGRLATCLTSPLRLYLAATIYAAPATTPADRATNPPMSLRSTSSPG